MTPTLFRWLVATIAAAALVASVTLTGGPDGVAQEKKPVDAAKGALVPNDPPAADVEGGSGPRHFAFHPSGKYAYVINELALTITAMSYDADKGALKALQTITTLPADVKDEINDALSELRSALGGTDVDKIKSAHTKLDEVSQKAGAALYEQTNAPGAGAPGVGMRQPDSKPGERPG